MENGGAHAPKVHLWASHVTSLGPFPTFTMKRSGFSVSPVWSSLASELLGLLLKNHRFPGATAQQPNQNHEETELRKLYFEKLPT